MDRRRRRREVGYTKIDREESRKNFASLRHVSVQPCMLKFDERWKIDK